MVPATPIPTAAIPQATGIKVINIYLYRKSLVALTYLIKLLYSFRVLQYDNFVNESN